jgi:protein SCO1/2
LRRVPTQAAAALVAAGVLGAAGCGGAESHVTLGEKVAKRATIPPGTTAQAFTLDDARHRRVSLAAQRGKVVLLTFLYTHCVDECPGIAHELNEVLRRLGPERRAVRVIAVSVDPVFDTPTAVKRFERTYRLLPQFRFLIGTRRQLLPVWRAYNVLVEARSTDLLNHSAPIYALDRRGVPRYAYPSHSEPGPMLSGVRELLRAS